MSEHYDIVVIGGGINGCGIARDAVGRGFKVLLCEQGDLASGTSSGSTKLVHGGLRYLEYYEFRLVREALIERETLWRMAPHIITPMRFILPHHAGLRSRWLIRAGLFLYDHIGGRKLLPKSRQLSLASGLYGKPLKATFKRGFEYSDCWVDDARLVVLNAQDAAKRGAEILPWTKFQAAQFKAGRWHVELRDSVSGTERGVSAAVLVNAAGPWVDVVCATVTAGDEADGPVPHDADSETSKSSSRQSHVRMVQGSHIVVRKLYDHDRSYIFQNDDGRITFAIPFQQDYTLIGTTDRDYAGDPGKVEITAGEINYLCQAANVYFKRAIAPDDVVWSYSAVRPLYDDGASKAQEATRDYVIELEGDVRSGAMITIYGGKITTYRKLAQAVMGHVEGLLGKRSDPWTGDSTLPGGDFAVEGFEDYCAQLGADYAFLEGATIARLARSYGTLAREVLGAASSIADLGRDFGGGLFERELRYLMASEWARTPDDILWRRTKLGLQLSADQTKALDAWMAEHHSAVLS